MIDRVRRIRRQIIQPSGPSILDAIADPAMFKPWFKNLASWQAWFAFLSALFALPMTDDQRAIYEECTGRTELPDAPATEGWLCCGRRAGKSFVLAVIAVYLATFRDYRPYLQPGERGTVMVIATDRKQARVIFRYVMGLLKGVSMFRVLIERDRQESVDLTNGVTIEIHTASFRSTRGLTLVACLLDEVAWYRSDESSNPDYEILNAVRPAMATIPNALLLVASSPYARRGILFNAWKRSWAKNGDPVLFWRAPTRRMNPSVPQSVIDAAMEVDAAAASAEYLAEWRADIEAFIQREAVEACVSPGVIERPFVRGLKYSAFIDPAGGSGTDSMTLACAVKDNEAAVLVALRERKPPFSPEEVVAEFCEVLRQYNITRVIGDKFGGEFVREPFKRHGITYEPSARPKTDLFRDFLGLLNSRRADLLDNERLINQISSLERRTARGGRDSIDHPPGAHDDLANVAAGALVNLVVSKSSYTLDYVFSDRDEGSRFDNAVDRVASLESMMTGRFW